MLEFALAQNIKNMIEILLILILITLLIGFCIYIYCKYIRPILLETEIKKFERKAEYHKQMLEAGYNQYEWRANRKVKWYFGGELDSIEYEYWSGLDYFKSEDDLRTWLKSCGWSLSWFRKN